MFYMFFIFFTYKQLNTYWKENNVYKPSILLGISTALAITGYIQAQRILLIDEPVVIDNYLLLSHAAVVGGLLLLLIIILTFYLLGRSPRSHRVLFQVILLAGIGIFPTSYVELKSINHAFDKEEPNIYETLVLDRKKFTSRKGTIHYLYTENWNNSNVSQKIRVPYIIYSKANVGAKLILCQKPGALGYRWLDKIIVTQDLDQPPQQVLCRTSLNQEIIENLDQNQVKSLQALYRKYDAKKNGSE
ncbi:hypothetical protein AMJAP_2759 [Amphritea japonica ATCC BAA-1530]|uniref:Uncharacterized protein n=2 Tax=Amphritea TaxID=515417 RepID=A0A7R6SU38_9GAMM|nr:hypothetical protein AMJAP_2759 [Amphritea japonica ATCC BAA-1530]